MFKYSDWFSVLFSYSQVLNLVYYKHQVNDCCFNTNTLKANILLSHFSCHSLRHTFTTRMCEAGVNVKVIQDALDHADIKTTLDIYADVTKDLKQSEFAALDQWFENSMSRPCAAGE